MTPGTVSTSWCLRINYLITTLIHLPDEPLSPMLSMLSSSLSTDFTMAFIIWQQSTSQATSMLAVLGHFLAIGALVREQSKEKEEEEGEVFGLTPI